MTAAIDRFLAAVRSHPVVVRAVSNDPVYAAHIAALDEGLAELARSDDPKVIAAHDEIAAIVRDGIVTREKMFALAEVMESLQATTHDTRQ